MQKDKLIDLDNMKILVVEDDPTSLYMLNIFLKKLKAQVTQATDGLIALDEISKYRFDLILMDVNMPGMDGFTASRKIRELGVQNQSGEAIVIIAMTAYALSGDKEKCINAGMNDYISKPIEFEELIKVISKYNQKKHSDIFNESTSQFQEDKNIFEAMVVELLDASGLDYESCYFILEAYINQSIEILESVIQLLRANKIPEVASLIHKLKGSSGNVRAKDVVEKILEGEKALSENDLNKFEGVANDIRLILRQYELSLR